MFAGAMVLIAIIILKCGKKEDAEKDGEKDAPIRVSTISLRNMNSVKKTLLNSEERQRFEKQSMVEYVMNRNEC